MLIKLLTYYIGHASNEQMIEPGVYAPGEAGLRGADAAYLVAIGKAEIVALAEPDADDHRDQEPDDSAEPDADPDDEPTDGVGSMDDSADPDADPDDTLELTPPAADEDPPSKSVRKRR